jgi:hypothetical protein
MRSTFLLLLTSLLLVQPAFAEEQVNLENGTMEKLPDVIYKTVGDKTRAEMGQARIPELGIQGGETLSQKKDPLLSEADRKRVIDRGIISAYAKWCGFDYKNASFKPFMINERRKGGLTGKQTAYMGALHDAAMNFVKPGAGACPAEVKEKLETLIVE